MYYMHGYEYIYIYIYCASMAVLTVHVNCWYALAHWTSLIHVCTFLNSTIIFPSWPIENSVRKWICGGIACGIIYTRYYLLVGFGNKIIFFGFFFLDKVLGWLINVSGCDFGSECWLDSWRNWLFFTMLLVVACCLFPFWSRLYWFCFVPSIRFIYSFLCFYC